MKKMMWKNSIKNNVKNNTLFNKIGILINRIFFIILIFIFITLFKINNSFSNSSIYKYFDSMENPNKLLVVNPNWAYSPFWETIARDVVFYDPQYGITSSFAVGIPTKPKNAIKTGVSFYDKIDEKSTYKIFPIYVSQWIYSPKLGRYYKLAGFGSGHNNGEDLIGFDYSFFIDNDYTKSRKNLKESPFNIVYSNGDLILSFLKEKFYEFRWFAMIGSNCYFDARRKEQKVKCYNELDTSDYERYIYYGTASKGERDVYMKFYNVYLLSSYYINEKDAKENKKSWILPENKKETRKILIMVPKEQVKYFIKDIKKLPDNALDNLIGYVWFMSKDIPNNNTGYKINYKKYDTKPNDKYDAELSRISNGKLKAKYGRYLTKERYSEDYIAPSIYGNNYNDEPEW